MDLRSCIASFWRGSPDGRWSGYKATTIVGCSAMAKTFIDNYWVLTSISLAGDGGGHVAAKLFYMLAEVAVASVLGGAVGLVVDYERSRYYLRLNNESAPML